MESNSSKSPSFAETFERIRSAPSDYLPEKCLEHFQAFWLGYAYRATSFEVVHMLYPAGFHRYVNAKFKNDTTHGAMSLVNLYARDRDQAWDNYFVLLDEFNALDRVNEEAKRHVPTASLEEIVPATLERPAMYFGSGSFDLFAAFVNGWLRATTDMQYEVSDYELRFRSLLKYIEDFDVNIPGPPWYRIIWFWTMVDEQARKLFTSYMNEYLGERKGCIQRIEVHKERRLKARST